MNRGFFGLFSGGMKIACAPDDGTGNGGNVDANAGETPEAKTAREASEAALKNETPEAKATREAAEKVSRDTDTASLKTLRDKLAPKEYAEFTLPDNFTKNEAVIAKAKETFKSLGLSQEEGQALVALQTQVEIERVTAETNAWNALDQSWKDTLANDPEIGGQGGADREANVALAMATAKAIGGDALLKTIEGLGIVNNPELVRAFIRVGKQMGDADWHFGDAKANAKEGSASFYDHPTSKKQ